MDFTLNSCCPKDYVNNAYSLLIYSCMKKVVVLALLLFVCVGSLFAQEDDKRKKKSITDSLFRIDQVDVMQKKKRIDLLGKNIMTMAAGENGLPTAGLT